MSDSYDKVTKRGTKTSSTLRNRYHYTQDKDYDLDIKRSEPTDLTEFDIHFNIIPEYGSQTIRNLSENEYARMREYLKSNVIYTKSYQYYTVYHIPVIGTFEKYDKAKNKYIYSEVEPDFTFSKPRRYVIYEDRHIFNSDYFAEKNPHKQMYALTDKNYKKTHFGRKYNKSKVEI